MTELSRDILQDWQVRKTKAQKERFIAFLQSRLPGLRVEEGGLPRCRNLVLGDPESADVVFSAHYDTCARLPFPNFITPKNLLIYLLYQLLILVPFFALGALLVWGLLRLGVHGPSSFMLGWIAVFGLILYVFLLGPANPHTVNDNTSGVVTLCELIGSLDEEELARCAFVFFDHEESGLFGSSRFASKHKKAMKDKLLINFDCVSDGDDLLFVQSGKAKRRVDAALKEAFSSTADKRATVTGPLGAFYPSDQINFPCGVGVAALNRSPLLGLYMSRIHTARDTVCDEANFSFLVRGVRRFLQLYRP
ncbi:MAG: M28 family peptidase [Oscillospiraceae bacterium]|nr:M28 family peptidase [Oscillospiraceae bacterium]